MQSCICCYIWYIQLSSHPIQAISIFDLPIRSPLCKSLPAQLNVYLGLLDMIYYSQTNCQSRLGHRNHQVLVYYVLSLNIVSNNHARQSGSTYDQSLVQGIYDHICLTRMTCNVNIQKLRLRKISMHLGITFPTSQPDLIWLYLPCWPISQQSVIYISNTQRVRAHFSKFQPIQTPFRLSKKLSD